MWFMCVINLGKGFAWAAKYGTIKFNMSLTPDMILTEFSWLTFLPSSYTSDSPDVSEKETEFV